MTGSQDLTGPASTGFWESTRPVPFLSGANTATAPAGRPQPPGRSAAALAAGVTDLVERTARKRVPRIDALRTRLQQPAGRRELTALQQALRDVQQAAGALDLLGARAGGAAAIRLADDCGRLLDAADGLAQATGALLARHAQDTPVSRLLWIELTLEAGALDLRVRTGARWLAEMDHDLATRRAATRAEVSLRALQELGRRGQSLRQRLLRLHGLAAQARLVQGLCEQVAEQRTGLCRTLREQVGPASTALLAALPLLADPQAGRRLPASELVRMVDACHALQVALTRAGAELARLQTCDDELATQLGWLAQGAQALD